MTPLWFDMVVYLFVPVMVLLQMYSDIRKGRKIVDRSFVVGIFYFTRIYYEISAGNSTRNELLNLVLIMGVLYFATFTVYYFVSSNRMKKRKSQEE